ncbi:uncharacterized protein LOC129349027 [Amphiprion ocellaris]|uniref:uncharacterized protein LOC129349027 n=1 Tax=Amphiprion ocellaris TaxID=80972 RepID=UPI00241105B2|nr:uncharacterized protein LOC129349027 [Amphiprion ocellaris]
MLWPNAGSVFASSTSSVSASHCSKVNSIHSNASSAKRQEAAAEYAATQAVLKIMTEQKCYKDKLQTLEAEDRLIVVDQEAAAIAHRLLEEKEDAEHRIEREKQEAATLKKQQEENAARKRSIQDLKRNLECLDELKRLNAAKARLKVYDEVDLYPDHEVTPKNTLLPTGVQMLDQVSPVFHYTQPMEVTAPKDMSQDKQGDLVKVLAEAISANRLPIPEPTIFSGDPLKFNHWKSSFQTLIERKNIPTSEKLFFLQRYVGGPAKEALEGHFLGDSEHSYYAAWDLLNERYGEPFVVAEAFRDKLHTWPKIGPKDSTELRKFVDFLRSCESAIVHNESLRVLDDGLENQKLASKLPDWLSTRWNRKATQYQLEHRRFPSFSYFVTFLSMDASIACNPIASYNALRPGEADKAKLKNQNSVTSKSQAIGAKIFTTNTSERNMYVTCMFCKKAGHRLPCLLKFSLTANMHLCMLCINLHMFDSSTVGLYGVN